MKQREGTDAGTLIAVALAVGSIAAWQAAPGLGELVTSAALRPHGLTLAGALVTFAVAVLAARRVATRRALRTRVRVRLLPSDTFDPPAEAVTRFAAGLGRSRRAVRGLLEARGSAVRIRLDHDAAGQLGYSIELPGHARQALRAAAGAYGEVEVRDAADVPALEQDDLAIVRAELVLARPSAEPLRDAGVEPDPLAGFARALGALRPELGDEATVCVDLLPVTPGRRRRLRRRLLREARRRQPPPVGSWDVLPPDAARGRGGRGASPAELVERRAGQHALMSKLGSPLPLFGLQVLVRVESPSPARARLALDALLAAFDVFAGDNHLRVSGVRVPGVAFLGSDLPGRRVRFDRRMHSGLFRPARRRLVTSAEIAGLLKPPTATCAARNVLRSGGVVAPPPPGLPTFTGQPDLLPLGTVDTEQGPRRVGAPLRDTYFFYAAGRSRFGKTEMAMGQFVHLARSGHGCFFLDPHQDGIARIKRYLTAEGLRDRVVEINLAAGADQQPGWNLFAAARGDGRSAEQVDAIVAAFASALGWTEVNARALNLTTQAAQALTDLAGHLPRELAPTVFQVPTLLSDDEWRGAILPYVSPATRQFFVERFTRLPSEAITPVTNLIDRLRVAPAVAALLGSPTSSYDVRDAMDRGRIVLICPGQGGARDRLVANLFVFDLLHAARTRAELPPARRRVFYAWLDEVQSYDSRAGDIAALLEQSGKFGIRALLFNQNPERLSADTLNAVTTNRSHLLTTALNGKAAALLSREWGGEPAPEVISGLSRYAFLGSVTLGGEISAPFRLRNLALDELFGPGADDNELAALDAAIDDTAGRAPVAETVGALDGHDRRIFDFVRRSRRGGRDCKREGGSCGASDKPAAGRRGERRVAEIDGRGAP